MPFATMRVFSRSASASTRILERGDDGDAMEVVVQCTSVLLSCAVDALNRDEFSYRRTEVWGLFWERERHAGPKSRWLLPSLIKCSTPERSAQLGPNTPPHNAARASPPARAIRLVSCPPARSRGPLPLLLCLLCRDGLVRTSSTNLSSDQCENGQIEYLSRFHTHRVRAPSSAPPSLYIVNTFHIYKPEST